MLAVDQYEVGADMTVSTVAPGPGQCMVAVSRFEWAVSGKVPNDSCEISLNRVPVSAFPLPPVIALELTSPSDGSSAIRFRHRAQAERRGPRQSQRIPVRRGGRL